MAQQPTQSGKCYVLFNPQPQPEKRTFCVLGSPRGGTSMVAGILRLLGVYMGEAIDDDNNEDRDFIIHQGRRDLFTDKERTEDKKQYLQTIARTIAKRGESFPVWGWKDPLSMFYVRDVHAQLENPFYIAIFRDSMAVTLGEMRKNKANPRTAIVTNAAVYRSMAEFAATTDAPVLCISYEKALQNSGELVGQLAKCIGVEVNPQELRTLSAYIEPNRNTGRMVVNSDRKISQRRLHSLEPVMRDYEYTSTALTRLALQGSVPGSAAALVDYAQRHSNEQQLFAELVKLMQGEQYEAAQVQLGLMNALYSHTFDIAPYDVDSIISGAYTPSQLPHLLVHYYFFSGIVGLVYRRDYDVALLHFRRAFDLALYYVINNIADRQDIGTNYLWSSKYHEGYTLKQMGRMAQAGMIKLFFVALFEARQLKETTLVNDAAVNFLSDGIRDMVMRELP